MKSIFLKLFHFALEKISLHSFELRKVSTSEMAPATAPFRSFIRNDRGVVAIIFVFIAVPIVFVIALSVDYARDSKVMTTLQDAADAAALAAVSPGVYSKNNSAALQQQLSSDTALSTFKSMVPPGVTVTSSTLVTTMNPNGLKAAFSFNASIDTLIVSVGNGKTGLSGGATAYSGKQTKEQIDLYVLMDVSQSMATGADQTTQTQMRNDPAVGNCAFACHIGVGLTNTIAVAASKGYQLRIDILKKALSDIIQKADDLAGDPNYTLRIALYAFASDFVEVKSLSSDFQGLKAAVNSLSIPSSNNGTNIKYALDQLQKKVAASKAAGRKSYAMLVTDGVSDSATMTPFFVVHPNGTYSSTACWNEKPSAAPPYAVPTSNPTSQRPCVPDPVKDPTMSVMGIDPTWCQAIKDQGVTMTTLYVQFGNLPDYSRKNTSDWFRNEWRHIFLNQYVIPNLPQYMSSCASSANDAYTANDTASVNTAINNIFEKYMFAPIVRLTH